jgi:hypothetical protein
MVLSTVRHGTQREVGPHVPSGAHEPQRPLHTARAGLYGVTEDLQIGVLRLPDEIHPGNLIPEKLLEAVARLEVHTQPRSGRRWRRCGLRRGAAGGTGKQEA